MVSVCTAEATETHMPDDLGFGVNAAEWTQ